jgi:hypothetical protein
MTFTSRVESAASTLIFIARTPPTLPMRPISVARSLTAATLRGLNSRPSGRPSSPQRSSRASTIASSSAPRLIERARSPLTSLTSRGGILPTLLAALRNDAPARRGSIPPAVVTVAAVSVRPTLAMPSVK